MMGVEQKKFVAILVRNMQLRVARSWTALE